MFTRFLFKVALKKANAVLKIGNSKSTKRRNTLKGESASERDTIAITLTKGAEMSPKIKGNVKNINLREGSKSLNGSKRSEKNSLIDANTIERKLADADITEGHFSGRRTSKRN